MNKAAKKSVLVFIFIAFTSHLCQGSDMVWTNDDMDNDWHNDWNWINGAGTEPTETDNVWIDNTDAIGGGPVITGDARANIIFLGANGAGSTQLTVAAQGDVTAFELGLSDHPQAVAVYNQYGNASFTSVLNIGVMGEAMVNIYGGTLVSPISLAKAISSKARFNIYDGTVDATAGFTMPADTKCNVVINIEAGNLILSGNVIEDVEFWAANGWLTGYGSPLNICVSYDEQTDRTSVYSVNVYSHGIGADINKDGMVNLEDLAILMEELIL
ncbi:hypothetical protein SMSP2_00765 [Limihaloglobus sulfuriphilus]|uniref:Dockerin domain-containing protein n=1 Tax=Limihaloglobus sulfuriphilus TaxID=1851148 RepID=A0A1Q2MDM7_9BACT|nr:hypothetical protein [Limihaloglobus sulfuriphilus]AQQ70417.1 hypothetical protein SMSP2_00765 [Limihaloglobus sulfuriphilus]